jgi:hypothetical protein
MQDTKTHDPSALRTEDRSLRERVRQLFLRPLDVYGAREAEGVTGIAAERVVVAIEEGEIEGELLAGGGFRVTWEQLALLAMDVWGLDAVGVEELLGDDASGVLPPLVRSVALTVRVSRWQLRVLEAAARRRGTTAGALVREALLSLAEEEEVAPDVAAAMEYPCGGRRAVVVVGAECGFAVV